jgi:uncharacterized repeat protein (TIGR01451 family)
MKKLNVLLVATLMLLALAGGASAWGTSAKIAAVDDQTSCVSNVVCSSRMGGVLATRVTAQGMTGDMIRVLPANVNAATLADYDTLFLFNCNPAKFSTAQKTDIVNFVKSGHKLVIWDAEDQYYECGGHACWDYSWLGTQTFSLSVPGAQGASGNIVIDENNQLSSSLVADPHFIDTTILSGPTSDAAGDANIFTSYVQDNWCLDMSATNALNWNGPVHVYSKGPSPSVGTGLIIFSGLDWDKAGDSYLQTPTIGNQLYKILAFEFNANSLPCGVVPTGPLTVTKTIDKYTCGKDITFDISVKNDATADSSNTVATDIPPVGVTCDTTDWNIGTLVVGETWSTKVTCHAAAYANGLTNSVIATGDYYTNADLFTGSDSTDFDIVPCEPTPTPEFPSLALPVGMIIGLTFIVYSLQMKRKE